MIIYSAQNGINFNIKVTNNDCIGDFGKIESSDPGGAGLLSKQQ